MFSSICTCENKIDSQACEFCAHSFEVVGAGNRRDFESQAQNTKAVNEVNPTISDLSFLQEFHEEFEKLVRTAPVTAERQPAREAVKFPANSAYEPNEIATVKLTAADFMTRLEAKRLLHEKPVAPRQSVKFMTGPRGGTSPTVERWAVKAVAALIGLNVLFATLIVSGMKLSDLVKWANM